MYSILAGLLVGVLVGLLHNQPLLEDYVVLVVCCGIGGGTFGCILSWFFEEYRPPKVLRLRRTSSIANMRSVGAAGDVFVTGSRDGTLYEYSMLVREANGSLSPRTIQSYEGARIVEDDALAGEDTGTYSEYERVDDPSRRWLRWAPINLFDPPEYVHEFRVPVGAVKLTFEPRAQH